jgi:hypothetical protein
MQLRTNRHFVARHYFAVAGLFLLGCAPAGLMVHFVTSNWVSVPFWDEWHTPANQLMAWCQGKLTFADLFAQHNESRKIFPSLVYLALAKVHGWDVRDAMIVFLLSMGTVAALLLCLLRRTPGATTISSLAVWVIMIFLCCSPVQFDNYLWGLQFEPLFPALAVLAAATVNLSGLSFGRKTIANALLALIATYTFANGMLLWVLALPLPSASETIAPRRRMCWYATYLVCAAAAIGSYFINYSRPSNHPPLLTGTQKVLDLAHYLLLWVGAYFQSSHLSGLIAGIIALAVFTGTMGSVIVLVTRDRNWRAYYPWLLLAAYACISATVTAAGRLGFGVKQALESRYTIFSLFFYLATIGALYALYCFRIRPGKSLRRNLFLGTCGVLIGLAMISWIWCYRDGLKHLQALHDRNIRLKRALEWIDAIPDNPDLALIFPDVRLLSVRTHTLAEHKVLRVDFANESIAAAIKQTPRALDLSNGHIDACVVGPNHELFITGWAWLPAEDRRADCVVIGCEDSTSRFKPVAVFETGVPRPDVSTFHHVQTMSHSGFARWAISRNFPRGDVKLTAWAIDLKKTKVYPLAGEIPWHID